MMRNKLTTILACAFLLVSACKSDEAQKRAQAESPQEQTAESEMKKSQEEASEKQGAKPGAEVMTKERQKEMTPQDVLADLMAGNERFVNGEMVNRNYSAQVEATSKGQYPKAIVLGCVDSRVPPELVFDQGIGDIFSARVAGNIINDELLGSIEFATKVAGSKLVVVLGHTSCGAVKGSCDNVDVGHITSLVKEIRPSVEAVTPEGETCSSKNLERVNKIAEHNVKRTIEAMRKKSDVLTELEKEGAIDIVGAMYDVSTGKVDFMEMK